MNTGLYLVEKTPDSPLLRRRLDKIFFYGNTRFQNVLIAHSPEIGTFLALDNDTQSSEADFHIYHESLVHTCVSCLKDPKAALIIGGGEGTTAAELSKYQGIKTEWIEIDREVVGLCKKYLPYSMKKARRNVRLIIGDGIDYINRTKRKYDLIIGDITEPHMNPIATKVYGRNFATKIYERLSDQGVYITLSWERKRNGWKRAPAPSYLKEVFPIVRPICFYMPSFKMNFHLTIASKLRDPMLVSDKKIASSIRSFRRSLRFYSERTHRRLFRQTL